MSIILNLILQQLRLSRKLFLISSTFSQHKLTPKNNRFKNYLRLNLRLAFTTKLAQTWCQNSGPARLLFVNLKLNHWVDMKGTWNYLKKIELLLTWSWKRLTEEKIGKTIKLVQHHAATNLMCKRWLFGPVRKWMAYFLKRQWIWQWCILKANSP